jgi:chemotaxis-related protein WspD
METTSCWKTIGVDGGDRSCDQLPELIHCRNCKVYAQGGRSLFDQSLPEDYRQMLTALVSDQRAQTVKDSNQQFLSLSLFRLQDEWFGLAAGVFDSVAAVVPIRRLPGRSNGAFLGMVNFSGELQLCISLKQVLGIDEMASTTKTTA